MQYDAAYYRSKQQFPSADLHDIDTQERDACALICSVRKGGRATHGNVKRTIEALARMGHRTGYINGEGDGVGILTDIPRQLWSKRLSEKGLLASISTNNDFWVAHVMIPAEDRPRAEHLLERINYAISEAGLNVLYSDAGRVNSRVLGPNAEKAEPAFYQLAGLRGSVELTRLDATLFELQTRLEDELGVHFPSFSRYSVVYKVQGTIEILRRYYPELRDPDYASIVTMGHARYSTNTNPIFERAQPFNIIGHNGEFNTISRFRTEAYMLDVPLQRGGSDSQDVDRMLQTLTQRYGLDLIEAMETIFPPYPHDLVQTQNDLQEMYRQIRQSWGHFAQGPAAVASRLGNQLVFSVDALGLRPLWFGETEKEYFASSERGVYQLDNMASDPRPMAPGEKIALEITPGKGITVLDYPSIQRHLLTRYRQRNTISLWDANDSTHTAPAPNNGNGSNGHSLPTHSNGQNGGNGNTGNGNYPADYSNGDNGIQQLNLQPANATISATEAQRTGSITGVTREKEFVVDAVTTALAYPWQHPEYSVDSKLMAGMGWERYHTSLVDTLAETGKEQIGSLGWDGPLAAMSDDRVNIADYFKETVAVVTNPSIDREREQAQFSTHTLIGARPDIGQLPRDEDRLVTLQIPFLLGGLQALGDNDFLHAIAEEFGTSSLDNLLAQFGDAVSIIQMSAYPHESFDTALERIQREAVQAVMNGTQCLLLDDTDAAEGENLWLDPLLVTAAVDKALRQHDHQPNLRRRTGIVLRSGGLRDLHDMALCISMGANALVPYALYAAAIGIAPRPARSEPDPDDVRQKLSNALQALTHGIEKVTSTMGCHELRGYGHSFSSIGLSKGIAAIFSTPNYFGSEGRGLTWSALKSDAEARAAEFRGDARARLHNPSRFNPRFWKKVEDVALGDLELEEFTDYLFSLEESNPVSIRHLLGTREISSDIQPDDVNIRIGNHDMPVLISAMSFGSQGELAYRTYAEAAKRLNIICMNGEGGELHDMLGKYKPWRGQQVASGRFGVNINFLNSADFIEVKIGQGAKPGEGGHLPGFKVTEQVAAARSTTPGVALISPSNNHDLYSIEDLAQLIDELKTANPTAKVSIKVPCVPGVGIIAVGIAKAGADIITLTGYTGGTGAARQHALRHVGLPAEIGLWLAHQSLIHSGLRDDVELWVDGGMKSGRDVVKMICLGANRVGFGSLAMMAVGCTICRGCQDGTCHVGITTHVKTEEEAEKKGFKSFRPFHEQGSPEGIVNVFNMLADDIRKWAAKLGVTDLQDLVGRADLLEQIARHDRIDLTPLLKPVQSVPQKPAQPGGRRVTRPRNIISRQMTEVISKYVERGELELTYDDEQVMAMDRALGTHLAGAIVRREFKNAERLQDINLSFSNSAIPGNGLGAFLDAPVNIFVEGGAQDGVAKCARGGHLSILKGLNHNGERLDGSVGKSFAYGAQGGRFIVQGNADSRACIRMSGADVIFGGEVKTPLRDELGGIGARANLKGYAFEYMTSGRVLVLGDPGPWICSGMTGGVVYQRIQPEMGLTIDAIERRIAPGSPIEIKPLDEQGASDVHELLSHYIQTLELNNQPEAVKHLYPLLNQASNHFVKLAPSLNT